MKVNAKKETVHSLSTDLLVIPLTKKDLSGSRGKPKERSKGPLPSFRFEQFNLHLGGSIGKILKREEFQGEEGQRSLVTLPGVKGAKAVLLVGWNSKPGSRFEEVNQYRALGSEIAKTASRLKLKRAALSPQNIDIGDSDHAVALLEGIALAGYRFEKYKSKKEGNSNRLREFTVLSSKGIAAKVVRTAAAFANGTVLARDLINMPACDCTPRYLVARARSIARNGNLKVQIFDKTRLKKLGAGALLSVSQGSVEPPYLIKLTYRPKKKRARVISLVGKGVTFDSGGLSIKSAEGMAAMKCDMSGAAAVLGAMQAVSTLKPNVEVRGYVPATENMINGRATRPGDVVKAMSGKTIEILNTDAEGRLILSDALCLAERDGADVIIDLATLTGACMVALGSDYAGLFCDDDKVTELLTVAGDAAGERLWRMPLAKEYVHQIKSSVADIRNIGDGRMGGAITAALFLKEFISKTPWAHLDIAGPAFVDREKGMVLKGGTGFGVRTLVRYVLSQ